MLSDLPSLDLAGAASFLLQYPYGCLEQTVSSAWPLLVAADLAAEVDPALVNSEERDSLLAYKIRQIGAMQLYNGGFAAWPGLSETYLWGSLYASHFLVEARRSGAPVPADMLEAALANVRSMLPLAPRDDTSLAFSENLTNKAYACYILALDGEAPLGWMAHLGEQTDSLFESGRIFLAGARALVSKTSKPLQGLGSSPSPERGSPTFESASRSTALKLLMWSEVDPLSATAADLATKLVEEARKGAWRTTQDNAVSILALGKWMEKTRSARKPFNAELKDESGMTLASFADGEKIALDLNKLPKGPLTLALSGEGTAYFAWTSAGVPLEAPEPFSNGVQVKRTWYTREGIEIEEGDPVSRGDRITAALTITPASGMRNLVVVDMLPGGMEIENPRLTGEGDERQYAGIRSEMRDDRLILFIDNLVKPVEYRYMLRAVSKGTFTLPPVAAEGMYEPENAFLGASGTVEID
jgi:hypothetical protein